jgi:hypothetical protein
MLKYLFVWSTGLLMGVGVTFAAYNLFVIRTAEKNYWVWKQPPSLAFPYVDVRDWGAEAWSDRPDVTHSMVEAGHGEVVARGAGQRMLGDLFRLGEAAFGFEQPARK